MAIDPVNPAIYSNEKNEIIYYERVRYTKEKGKKVSPHMRTRVFQVDKDGFSELNFNTEVKFHHPYLFYIYDNNEIWMHKIDDPTTIHRYMLPNSITAIDFLDDVYNDKGGDRLPCSFMCLLTYKTVHRIAEISLRDYPKLDNAGQPKPPEQWTPGSGEKQIKTFVMDRFKQSIPVSNVTGKIVSFSLVTTTGSDFYVMFHYLNRIEFYDIQNEKVVCTIPVNCSKRNIIKFDTKRDSEEYDSNIFFWSDNGRTIDRLQPPTTAGSTDFKLFNAYNSIDKIKLCKKLIIDRDTKGLLISDQKNNVKILKYDPADKKFEVLKDLKVSDRFGINTDLDTMNGYCLSKGVLYSNNQTFLLQPKSKYKTEISIEQKHINFEKKTSRFPLCSEQYIIRQVDNSKEDIKINGKPYSGVVLHMAPPVNAHEILHSVVHETDIEFFLHSDNSRIIRVLEDKINNKITVKMFNYRELNPIDTFVWDLTAQGVTPREDVGRPIKGKYNFETIISQDGHYICAVYEKINEVRYQILEIDSKNDNNSVGKQEYTTYTVGLASTLNPVSGFDIRSDKRDREQYRYDAKMKWRLTNDKTLIGVDLFNKNFFINSKNYFESIDRPIKNQVPTNFFGVKTVKLEYSPQLSNTVIGEDYIVTVAKKYIYSFKFNLTEQLPKFEKFQRIKHTIIEDIENITATTFAPTSHKDYFLIFYKFEKSENIMIWNLANNEEYDNFYSRPGDKFACYCSAIPNEIEKPEDEGEEEEETEKRVWKSSEIGYLMFNYYYVNLDSMVVSPFICCKQLSLSSQYWNMGTRMSSNENFVLIKGHLISSFSFMGVFLRSTLGETAPTTIEACKYFIDKCSIISDFDANLEQLKEVLELLRHEPIYYTAICLPDNDGESPLVRAIERNAPKTVELFLKYLSEFPDFKLSKSFHKDIDKLFDMGIIEFKDYLQTCYFQTGQMKMIDQISSRPVTEKRLEGSYTSILSQRFLRFLPRQKEADKKINRGDDDKHSDLSLDESSSVLLGADIDEEESVLSVEEVKLNFDDDEKKKQNDGLKTTVVVKAIEFDWLLKTQAGESFLQNIADTEDLTYFDLDIVKELIMFQWRRFLPRIMVFLILPFMTYFILFIVFATYVVNERHMHPDSSYWETCVAIYGIILIVLQTFFVAVEMNQIVRDPAQYITSFWNVMDVSSIVLNYVVIAMALFDANLDDQRAVAAVAVLLLWIRLFYLFRIFNSTSYLVSMITYIIIDMRWFVAALTLAILAFGNAYYILGRNSEEDNFAGKDVWEAFIFSLRTGFGDFNTEGFGTPDEELIWVIWVINTIIIVIILLNLVIAIMGNTFERVQETQEATKLKEQANIIRENEFLFDRKTIFADVKYIIVITPDITDTDDNGNWAGKLLELRKKLVANINENKEVVSTFTTALEKTIEAKLKEKMKPLEDKFNNQIDTLDTMLVKALAANQNNSNQIGIPNPFPKIGI